MVHLGVRKGESISTVRVVPPHRDMAAATATWNQFKFAAMTHILVVWLVQGHFTYAKPNLGMPVAAH